MNYKELKELFETIATNHPDIKSFAFDNLSQINLERDRDYPILFLAPPTITHDVRKGASGVVKGVGYEDYRIAFWVMGLNKQADDGLSVAQTMKTIGEQVIVEALQSVRMVTNVTKTYGQHLHTEQLIGFKFEFTIRVNYCLPDLPEIEEEP